MAASELAQLSRESSKTMLHLLLAAISAIHVGSKQNALIKSENQTENEYGAIVCNLRILTRVLPFAFESDTAVPHVLNSTLAGCLTTMARLFQHWTALCAGNQEDDDRVAALLRCFLVVLSRGVYAPREVDPKLANPVLAAFLGSATDGAQNMDNVLARTLLATLFEKICQWQPSRVSYSKLIKAHRANTEEMVVVLCIHLACALLTFPFAQECSLFPTNHFVDDANEDIHETIPTSESMQLDARENKCNAIDHRSLFLGLLRMLQEHRQGSVLPGPSKSSMCFQEIFVLMYMLIISSKVCKISRDTRLNDY